MRAINIDGILPGNAFMSDAYHMGTVLGRNVTVMYARHPDQEHQYIIVVNTKTGERIQINLNEEEYHEQTR